MATLSITCPNTGNIVSTGIDIEREDLQRLPDVSSILDCPERGRRHGWRPSEAWLTGASPNAWSLETSLSLRQRKRIAAPIAFTFCNLPATTLRKVVRRPPSRPSSSDRVQHSPATGRRPLQAG